MLTKWESALKSNKEVIVFGQSDYSARLIAYIEKITDRRVQIIEFIFSLTIDKTDETNFEYSSRIIELENIKDKSLPVFVAFSHKNHDKSCEFLRNVGFYNLILYDSGLDNEMKKQYFKLIFEERGMCFNEIDELSKKDFLTVYIARNIHDKETKDKRNISCWEEEIQVGKALTDKKICNTTDDTGDNISTRNKRYCEMTAAYWAWKNVKSNYIGLSHYRRRFKNLDEIALGLGTNNIDAVLPLPTLAEKSFRSDYLEKHIPDVSQVMLDILKEKYPEDEESFRKILDDKIFYASNMWILKKNVLDDFLGWMFPILFEIEKRISNKYKLDGNLPKRADGLDDYYNRYAGFCSERLETLYFIKNYKKFSIYHVEKDFLS